jgi:hypothetical protein
MTTVEEARQKFAADLGAGEEVFCCVCDRRSHIDGRPFDLTLARALNFMRQWDDTHPREFIKMAPALNEHGLNPGNVAALLRHWFLIEPEESTGSHGRDGHGMYRITKFGRDFLLGTEDLPLMTYTYKGVLYAFSDEHNTFEDGRDEWITIAYVEDFDYKELWLR